MDQYALYLRKSRADLDAEARGEGETLAKHRAALTDLARRRGLLITREYAELVSGDTIAARPQMQALLEDVKAGMFAGVLVNDVDRLGRGDGIDQEIIKYTFAASRTRIITPSKDIDFASTTDEDLYDFKAFFARTELKMISRRMAQGRARSAAAGNWIAGAPPFGFRRVKSGRSTTLEPDPDTAPVVRMMFDWYAQGEAGYFAISRRLAAMGVKTSSGHAPGAATVRNILHNPAYVGRLAWGRTSAVSAIEDGRRVKRRVKSDPAIIEGAFPAIISEDVWQAVQDRAALARHRSPVNANAVMRNPLAGLVYCSECGCAMCREQGKKRPLLQCHTPGCATSATYLDTVEDALLETLRSWCATYAAPIARPMPTDTLEQRDALTRQLDGVVAQLTRVQELLETGVYSVQEYLARKAALDARKSAINAEIDKLTRKSPDEARAAILPDVERVLDAYPLAQSVEQKNALLRSVVDRVIYHKTQSWRARHTGPLLSLDVWPVGAGTSI